MKSIKVIDLIKEDAPEDYKLETEDQPWRIKNDQEADWYIEVKQEEIKEILRVELQVQEKLEKYQHKLDKLRKERQAVEDNLEYQLTEYFEQLPDKAKKKTKTQEKYRLPSGDIIKKFPKPKIKRDDAALRAWLEQNKLNQFIEEEVVKKVKWADMKKDLKDDLDDSAGVMVYKPTGEIIEGIELQERPPKVEIKID